MMNSDMHSMATEDDQEDEALISPSTLIVSRLFNVT